MPQRELQFRDFDEVLAEIQRLRQAGCAPVGQWNLAQVCEHLAYFIEGSLDGYTFRVNWLLKVLFGRFMLRRILKSRRMKPGVPTPQKPMPASDADEAAAVTRLQQAIARFRAHQGAFHPSPFFGTLTPEQWRDLHLIHCGHHLGFLVPQAQGGDA